MKYLLLGLILLAGHLHASAPAPIPRRLYALVDFAASDPAGTTTEVGIYLNDTAEPPAVGISVYRNRRLCVQGSCREVPVIAGYTVQPVGPNDARIDRQLRSGSLDGTLRLHDDATNTDLPIRVDIEWIATGPLACSPLDDGEACLRSASVVGEVTSGADRLIANQTAPDGQLIWGRPTY